MELHIIDYAEKKIVVLLDDDMRIVKPVYNYLKFQRQKDKAFNTLKANGIDLKLYWEYLVENTYDYDQVTPQMIAKFIEYLRKDGDDDLVLHKESKRSNRTINRILSTIHMFYQYCANMQEIDNPILMHDINRPQNMFKSILYHARSNNKTSQSIFKLRETKQAIRIISEEEMEITLEHLSKQRDRILYKLLYFTGARIQEVLDLKIGDVPLPDASTSIGVFQHIKSKGKNRNLYVPMEMIEVLDDFILNERCRIETEHDYIFVSEQNRQLGKPLTYSAAYYKLKEVRQKTGIHFSFHDLRHTFCTNLVQTGMDVSIVQIIMGHEHLSTTQKYTHLTSQYIADSLIQYWNNSNILYSSDEIRV